MTRQVDRRRILRSIVAMLGSTTLYGCDRHALGRSLMGMLGSAEWLDSHLQHALAGRRSMAQEFSAKDISPDFPGSGTEYPAGAKYHSLAASAFADWRLHVTGRVAKPAHLSLAQLRALPSRTQITRHDCVDGWSAIGKWTGVPLSVVLSNAVPLPDARYVAFRCADARAGTGAHYYESIDMDDAFHPQTILAYALNGAPLPIKNGAPLRVRVERQLGYKMAKYLMQIEVVADFSDIGGRGGTYEDNGYAWYAGI